MADAILMSGGTGGVSSDDVTASKDQVLQGYKTVTTDSDDELVEGTIPNRGNIVDTVELVNAHWDSNFLARMEQGYYSQNGQYKPCVAIPYAVLANVAGVDASKMLDTLTVAGVRGTIHVYGAWNNTSEVVNATWEDKLHVRFEEGYYLKEGNYKPAAVVPYAIIANVLGVDSSKMLDGLTIAGKRGQIKSVDTAASNYRINKSTNFGLDNWTNPSNPVFYVDFPHGNGYYFRGDNHPHTCIDAVALGDATPDKVMRGFTATSKNGVKFAGTMPDYSTGRTVFNGATFDGILASGVANKGFYLNNNYYAYWLADFYRYAGIYDGGINLAISTGWPAFRSRRVGCVLSQSINVTPFRSIVISYHAKANIEGKPYVSLEAHVSLASGRSSVDVGGKQIDSIRMLKQTFASVQITRNGQMVIDVSDINDFIFLSFGAFCNYDKTSDIFEGAIQITKIDFLN